MRLLYGITYYLPHVSGLTLGLVPLVEGMLEAGHDVTVIAARVDPARPVEERDGRLRLLRVPVSLWIGKGPLMLGHALRVWRETRRGDIVHLWLPQFDAGPAALVARLRGARVVVTYVCSFTAPGVMGRISMLAARASHLLAGLMADRVVALSADYAAQSGFCRLFAGKISHIPLPVRDYPAEALPRRPSAPPWRIGFVGRIAAEKNIHLLLDALPALRRRLGAPFTLELVGPEDPPVSAPQRALHARLAACDAPELRRLGRISEAELEAFYRGIDVLVLPSTDRIEAYGLVQVEAMLRGVPCVTSDRPGMREPIRLTGFGRLFRPGDAEALAEALAEVLTGPPEALAVAPETIHRSFDPARIVADYAALYAGLPGAERPSAR